MHRLGCGGGEAEFGKQQQAAADDGLGTGWPGQGRRGLAVQDCGCLLYTSDAADDLLCVDLGGRRIIKKKKKNNTQK